jgi:hypothetical protein
MDVLTVPARTRWQCSGKIELSKENVSDLLKWLATLKKQRLPRRLKKRIKADIHRFFAYKKRYNVGILIKWQKQFNIKKHV